MSDGADASHGVIFLPYAHSAEPYRIAGVEFVPLRMSDGSTNPVLANGGQAMATILASYRSREGTALQDCIVATMPVRGWDLTESDLGAVQWAASLLFLAAWARNKYFPRFGGPYINSSSFRPVCQKFSGTEPVYIGLHSRRRDGGTLSGGYRHGDALFTIPGQCSVRDAVAVDVALLAALDGASAADSVTMTRLLTALPFAGLANTDDDLMTDSAEAILMASAFEQLLGSDEHAYGLGKLFGELMSPFGNVTVAEASRERPGISIDATEPERAVAQPKWWVHRKWMEELHQLRSQAVHEGHAQTGADWGWKMNEHMLMAAHAFPLTVKALLQREGHYAMTSEEDSYCRAMDKLLSVNDWDEDTDVGPKWNKTISETVRHDHLRRIADDFLARHASAFLNAGASTIGLAIEPEPQPPDKPGDPALK